MNKFRVFYEIFYLSGFFMVFTVDSTGLSGSGSRARIDKINCSSLHSKQPPRAGMAFIPSLVCLNKTDICCFKRGAQSAVTPIRGAPRGISGLCAWQLIQKC